jgi:ABC-type lipoprotein export system ATPase subunit
MTDAALVRAEGISKTYRVRDQIVAALTDASFTIEQGDRIAITGPSGSGKTTLLHLIAGLDAPTEGAIEWPSFDREHLRPSKITIAFQGPSLVPALSVLENIELPMLLADLAQPVASSRAADALIDLGLAGLGDKLPEELSGGQLQRAAIARAVAIRPMLILADEPTGQQDQETGQALLDKLLAHAEEAGAALVVATHDSAVADRMDRRWRLEAGRLDAEVLSRLG